MQKKYRSVLLGCVLFLIGFLISYAPVECAAKAFATVDGNKILLDKNLSRKKVVRLLQPQIEKWATTQGQKQAA